MTELELTRAPRDRHLFALGEIGTLRFGGLMSRAAVAEAGMRRWRIARRGFWGRQVEATDETGSVVGEFAPRGLRRGGTLIWGGRELGLRPSSAWRERYALVEGEREIATLDGKGWGRRPVAVTVADVDAIDPGLLLVAAFVVRRLAEDANAAAGAGAGAASSG